MLRTISRALVALALLAGPAAAQSFTLPELGLQSTGTCRQLAARDRSNNAMVALGCLDTTKHGWVLTPSTLQIAGPGSTGDVSGMSVTGGGTTQTLATWLPSLASIASPNFTGAPTAPTAAANSNSTQIANTAWVANSLASYLTSSTASATYAPQASPFFTGTMQMGGTGTAPATQGTGYQFYARRYLNGTAAGINASLINVEQDTATVTGPNFANYFTVQGFFGGSGVQGGRQAIQAQVYQTAATSASNVNRNYVGILGGMYTSSGDGGTGLTASTALGGYFGMNPAAILQNGATNVLNLSGLEVNVAAQTGSSVYYKSGIQIAALASDTVPGSFIDAGITIGAQGGAQLMKQGIYFGTQNGGWPFNGSSVIIQATGGQVGTALDFRGVGLSTGGLLLGPSGGLYDTTTNFGLAHGGSVLLALVGSTGQKAINLVGRSNLSPVYTSTDDVVFRGSNGGTLDMNFPTSVTQPPAGGAAALPATPKGYLLFKQNGTPQYIPYY